MKRRPQLWRADTDDVSEIISMTTGIVSDLTMYEEATEDGLVFPDGTLIPRSPSPPRPMGFQPPRRTPP